MNQFEKEHKYIFYSSIELKKIANKMIIALVFSVKIGYYKTIKSKNTMARVCKLVFL